MIHPNSTPLKFALVAVASLIPALALASGTQVGFKDPMALARGNAFVATADNASAVYYNPAGLSQLRDEQLLVSAYEVSVRSDYTGSLGAASLRHETQSVPQFFVTSRPANALWGVGFGVYAPFGLSTDWGDSSVLRDFATKSSETVRSYNASLAVQVLPNLSIGTGLVYNRVDVTLARGLGVFAPNDLLRVSGRGQAWSGNFGVLWQPSEQHSIGVSYQSGFRANLTGTTDTIPVLTGEPSSLTLPFPDVLILGYSYRPTPLWNIEADINRTKWSSLGTVIVSKSATGPLPLVFDWQNTYFYEAGVTRYLPNHWSVSGGLCYTGNSTPDSTFTPAVPDGNRLFYSVGAGYTADRFSFNLGLHYGAGGTRQPTITDRDHGRRPLPQLG